MNVRIADRRVRLDERAVLGTGGEAVVIRHDALAIKLYHQPTPERARKLAALLALNGLPQNVLRPMSPVYDGQGRTVLGFAMCALDPGYVALAHLSNKGYRATHAVRAAQVVALFVDIHRTLGALHGAGLVVGDLNDANVLFNGSCAAFVDVDSYQYRDFACGVATEAFLDPALYGRDLAAAPAFTPDNDWYSFAVLLFRALVLAHPYGGTHPQLKTLTARAGAGVTVFDPAVTYPKVGLHPATLSDDLMHHFQRIFAEGWRGTFPLPMLTAYAATLVTCPTCDLTFPISRRSCPTCEPVRTQRAPIGKTGAIRTDVCIAAGGDIVAWCVVGERVMAVAADGGRIVLYREGEPPRDLSTWQPGARYALMREYLVINPLGSAELRLVPLGKGREIVTATGTYGTTPVFATTADALYRTARGVLLRGEIVGGLLVERPVATVMPDQTWYVAAGAGVIGVERVFQRLTWFAVDAQGRHTLNIPALLPAESVRDHAAYSDGKSVLIVRHSRLNGRDWLRLDTCTPTGTAFFSTRRVVTADVPALNGLAYAAQVVLWPDNAGIIQDAPTSGTTRTLDTEVLDGQTTLGLCGAGLVAQTGSRIYRLTLQ